MRRIRIPEQKVLPIIKSALREDLGSGDITTKLTIAANQNTQAVILTKEDGVVCGLDLAGLVFRTVDRKIHFQPTTNDGTRVRRGEILARLEGNARSILQSERVVLNFLGRLSGIATLTDGFVQRVEQKPVKIMDTRKTTPGLRLLEKYAVRCGGGVNHRMGLWDQILVKDNHLTVVSRRSLVSREKTLAEIVRKIRRKKPRNIKIEVEVKNLEEFKVALLVRPDVIMLDNMPIRDIQRAVEIRAKILDSRHWIPIEVSGGINLQNVQRIAACGVEMISIGRMTNSAQALDVALNFE